MADTRFYLDENVQVVVAEQLALRGIDAVTVRSLELLGDEDENHLVRATGMGRILCTHDTDYYELAMSGRNHAGIIIGQAEKHTIGDWVKGLVLIHAVYTAEDMENRVEFL
jgi:predicted nuclease of predicted toxin-antitoxin system